MKDPETILRNLEYIYLDMPFKLVIHRDGSSDYSCTMAMLRTVKDTVNDAAETIKNLLLERDSLLDLLEEKE